MSNVVFSCHSCGATVPLEFGEKVSRREECAGCGADLHCCRNCRFFDPGRNNQCSEPQAERVVDKTQSNFCDYFEARTQAEIAGGRAGGASSKKQFDDLFK